MKTNFSIRIYNSSFIIHNFTRGGGFEVPKPKFQVKIQNSKFTRKIQAAVLFLLFFNVQSFSQALWQPSGSDKVYTMRKTGVGTNNPAEMLDVNGRTKFRGNSSFDSSVTALKVKAQSAEFATAIVTGQISAGSLNVSGSAVIGNQLSVIGQVAVGSGSGSQLLINVSCHLLKI